MDKKYKIIGVSNFNLDHVSDFLVADNLNKYYGEKLLKYLINDMHESDSTYYRLVDQDYELYKWQP